MAGVEERASRFFRRELYKPLIRRTKKPTIATFLSCRPNSVPPILYQARSRANKNLAKNVGYASVRRKRHPLSVRQADHDSGPAAVIED